MHVDGFRFDLATTLGRVGQGEFDPQRPLFQIINQDPVLSRVKLIAEPWDVGLGGYQVGSFPAPWREWNGKYRDAMRRYWKGDENLAARGRLPAGGLRGPVPGRAPPAPGEHQLRHRPRRLHPARPRHATAHKHNEANGEHNRDGADDNQSWNRGVEGETDDPEIIALRERQKRNLLATLLFVAGRAHAAGRRRDGPHPGRQQQRLLPGQRALLAGLEPRRAPKRRCWSSPRASSRCAGGTRCCSSAASSRATTSGTRSPRTWPGSAPTAGR